MGKSGRGDFTDILISKKNTEPEQLNEAKSLQAQTGIKLQDAAREARLHTMDEVMARSPNFTACSSSA